MAPCINSNVWNYTNSAAATIRVTAALFNPSNNYRAIADVYISMLNVAEPQSSRMQTNGTDENWCMI